MTETSGQAEGQTEARTNVPMLDFVTAWSTSSNVQEVADKLGITKESAGQRASQYRTKHGINLKKFTAGGTGSRLDINAANELIAQLAEAEAEGEGEAEPTPAKTT